MSFHEKIIPGKGHILYWVPLPNERFNSNKILGMDLDWTLIKPIKGKVHPIDETDWELLYNDTSALEMIKTKQKLGYKFVIFTNQGGLLNNKPGKMNVEGFKKRWLHILELLKITYDIKSIYLIVSLYDDFNRKPATGMWDFLEKELNDNIKVIRQDSLYVGDMAGRKGDYSASDLLFSMNLGVDFQVPEVFFLGNASSKNKTTKLQKSILEDENIFNGHKFIMDFPKSISQQNKSITNELLTYLHKNQCIVIFIGSPASGKTSYYHNYLSDEIQRNVNYMNMDTFLGTPAKFLKSIDAELQLGNSVIIDNTNGTRKTRYKYLALVKKQQKDIKVVIVHIKTEKRICMHLNALRTKINNIASIQGVNTNEMISVPAVAIHTYWKYFEPVNIEIESSTPNASSIDKLFSIEFEPSFLEIENDSLSTTQHKIRGITPIEFSLFL